MSLTIQRNDITGLVLAGGRGSRMGGVDKGLQPHRGVPLALHALRRLAPQVGPLLANANRHLDDYRAFGVPVVCDAPGTAGSPPYAGPLAGLLAGLRQCTTPYLASVPCDSPEFPLDLVARLAAALAAADAEVAIACTRSGAAGDGADTASPTPGRPQPVFCLMRVSLVDSLQQHLDRGQRQVERWAAGQRRVDVPFDDAAAFVNANTAEELARLQAPPAA